MQTHLLRLEYNAVSPSLRRKIQELRENYTSFRGVRGDGNCFYRAFKFAYLERILLMNDQTEANRILAKVEECRNRILVERLVSSESLYSDFSAFQRIVVSVSPSTESRISHELLLEQSRDEQGYGDPAIRFLRFVTASEIRKRPDHYGPSILGLSDGVFTSIRSFCEAEVEPMGMEVDNMQIAALVDALGVAIRIEYVCEGKYKLNHHDLGMEASMKEPYVTLLYTPGHYEILYNKEYHKLVPEPVRLVSKSPGTIVNSPGTAGKCPGTAVKSPGTARKDLTHIFMKIGKPVFTTYLREKKPVKDVSKGPGAAGKDPGTVEKDKALFKVPGTQSKGPRDNRMILWASPSSQRGKMGRT